MVNRYDSPAQAEFVNTYVPIPFQELVSIGKELNVRRDAAEKVFRDTMTDWKKFYSPSAVDTESWKKATYGSDAAKEVINKYVADPNYVKTAEGQAALANLTNNADIATMQKLQLNAQNLNTYLKNRADLQAKGLYDETWDDVDVTNYDTVNQGVLKQLSPLEYRSIVDITKPFVDNLHESSMGGDGQYLYSGVSKKRTRAQVESNMSGILNSPFADKHIESIMRRDKVDRATAKNKFINKVYQAANEFAWTKREVDPSYLAQLRASRTSNNSNSGGAKTDNVPLTLTESISLTGKNLQDKLYREMFASKNDSLAKMVMDVAARLKQAEGEYKTAVNSGDSDFIEEKENAYRDAYDSFVNIQQQYATAYNDFLKNNDLRKMIANQYYYPFIKQTGTRGIINDALGDPRYIFESADDLARANTSVINKISAPVASEWADQILAGISSTSNVEVGSGNKARTFTNTSGLQLATDFVSEYVGANFPKDSANYHNIIGQGLRDNAYRNVRVVSVDRITSVNNGTSNKAIITIAIPKNQIFTGKETEEERNKKNEAIAWAQGVVNQYKSETNVSGSWEGATDDKSNLKGFESYKKSDEWIEIPVVTNLPNTGEGTPAEMFNQYSWQQNMTSAKAADLLHLNQVYNTVNQQ